MKEERSKKYNYFLFGKLNIDLLKVLEKNLKKDISEKVFVINNIIVQKKKITFQHQDIVEETK